VNLAFQLLFIRQSITPIFQNPIFNLACSYMLWKSRDRALGASLKLGLQKTVRLDSDENRREALQAMLSFAEQQHLSGAGKDELAQHLAEAPQLQLSGVLCEAHDPAGNRRAIVSGL
jgi:hypothetical protein